MFGSTRKMLPFKAASQNKFYSFNIPKKSISLNQKETENILIVGNCVSQGEGGGGNKG